MEVNGMVLSVWAYSIASVVLVSLLSLIGVLTLAVKPDRLQKVLLYLVSFAAGALLGDAFIHLLPEASKAAGFTLEISLWILAGISATFILEKFVIWRDCHQPPGKGHVHSFTMVNIVGEAVHNFIDGLTIGASYMASVPVGIATTTAVIYHEIPHELGDFAVLVHGGFSAKKAVLFNFLISLTAVAGTVAALMIGGYVAGAEQALLPFAAGNFIYIAGTDLVPELHKDVRAKAAAFQLMAFLLGIGAMAALLAIG